MTGMEIYDGYGQTEAILICGNFRGAKIKPGSMGRPSPGVPLFIIDTVGRECEVGVEGDIAILIENNDFFGIFEGYLKSDGTLDRQTKILGGKPWYLPGDRATIDEGGYFWFVGRADDVINSSGYRIGELSFLLSKALNAEPLHRTLRSRINTQAPPCSGRKCSRHLTGLNKKRSSESLYRSHFRVRPEDEIESRNRGFDERDSGFLQEECKSV
jgi:AMP-binding enzyme